MVAEAHRGHVYLARRQERTHYRRAYVDPVEHERFGALDLDAEFAAVSHVVVEAFGTVVAEAVVVTRYQAAHVKAAAQHVLHEVVCRERSHLPVEVEHLAAVNARGGYQPALLFAGGEQARLELLVQHKARMSVEGDYRRLQSKLSGTVDYALYEELVPTVYTVEKAYRGYARGCAMRCVHVGCGWYHD